MSRSKKQKWYVKALLWLLKIIFYYPAKGLWWLLKKMTAAIQLKLQHRREAKEQRKKEALKPQTLAHYVLFTEIENKIGSLKQFEQKLYSGKSTIGLILGARGTGKSAIGMRLLENFKTKTSKKIYALGFKEESLPEWITVVSNINEIENDSVILVDEGGIEFSSRRAMSDANKLMSELLMISRHKDLSVIFITQNSSNLEVNVIRQADYLLLKPSSLLQKDFERKKIQDIYEAASAEFQKYKEVVGLTYVYADTYRGFVTNTLPSFWSDTVSKGYRDRK